MTEQEQVELKREAFAKGFYMGAENYWALSVPTLREAARKQAERAYPDPPQPREIELQGTMFRVVNGEIQVKNPGYDFWPFVWYADSIRALHDLLERPNV